MNMHGIMVPAEHRSKASSGERMKTKVLDWIKSKRVFLLIVVLPTLLVAAYYYLIASDQYQSEAHFLVRSAGVQQAPATGLASMLTAATGSGSSSSEAMSVADYLTSHDVVDTLTKKSNLVGRFQASGIDPISRLHGDPPTPERILKYFRNHVTVKFDTDTNITTVAVRGFSPKDSFELVERLLELGEARVNILNDRSYRDTISAAQRLLSGTEDQLAIVQSQITRFRQNRSDIDPTAVGQAQVELVAKLNGDLAAARAQLGAMGKMIDPSSPQYRALAARVAAFQGQIAGQSGRLTGSSGGIANDISGYETLRMRQEFLTKRYEAAAVSLDKAREQAQRQQLYVVRVVQPNVPVKSLYPERGRVVLTVFLTLMIAYALGWLIIAGTREHAA